MKIKDSIKPYYHLLYRTLKTADRMMKESSAEELVSIMVNDIVRLDALISLLVYVDGGIPLLRTQKAFSKMKAELEGLSYLYREQKLMTNKQLNFIDWELGASIESEIKLLSDEFGSKTHEIYLNAIHAGEKAIDDHISKLSEEKLIVGILAYFTDCLEEIEEKSIDEDLHQIGYLIRSLLANLQFIAQIHNKKAELTKKHFYLIIVDMVNEFKFLHIYDMTIKAIGIDNQIVGNVVDEIKQKYVKTLKSVVENYDRILREKDNTMGYVKYQLLKEENFSETKIRESIHARNLLHSLT